MKLGKLLIVLFCVSACCMVSKTASADLVLELSMTTGECTGAEITVEIHRENTDFDLAGLSYDLQFSEPLTLTREYSHYGWTANDGMFDLSNPADGAALAIFQSIRFDTVVNPVGEEFPGGTSGTIEALTINPTDLTPRWIYFDLSAPSACNGEGQDMETSLGGSIDVDRNDVVLWGEPSSPPDPDYNYTLAVYVPEPSTLTLIGVGSLLLRKKRR